MVIIRNGSGIWTGDFREGGYSWRGVVWCGGVWGGMGLFIACMYVEYVGYSTDRYVEYSTLEQK